MVILKDRTAFCLVVKITLPSSSESLTTFLIYFCSSKERLKARTAEPEQGQSIKIIKYVTVLAKCKSLNLFLKLLFFSSQTEEITDMCRVITTQETLHISSLVNYMIQVAF